MNLIKHVAHILQIEDAQQNQLFQKQRYWDRLNFVLLLHINQNMPVLLVGVSLAFATERLIRLLDAKVSDDAIAFFFLGIRTLLWLFALTVHILYTLSFIVLQNSLPETSLKSESARTLKAFEFIFIDNNDAKMKLRTLRRCSIMLCFLLCLLLIFTICSFLYNNDLFININKLSMLS